MIPSSSRCPVVSVLNSKWLILFVTAIVDIIYNLDFRYLWFELETARAVPFIY